MSDSDSFVTPKKTSTGPLVAEDLLDLVPSHTVLMKINENKRGE
jgi:hypothetical protein